MPNRKIKIKGSTWGQLIRLAAKLCRYATGGISKREKADLLADLLDLVSILSDDISEDLKDAD
jgi:hypothetical protein|tara:strand:- start:1348 stop:1536 length:189 start_codon:yes stop_codon:yes gene_type:complete